MKDIFFCCCIYFSNIFVLMVLIYNEWGDMVDIFSDRNFVPIIHYIYLIYF